MKRVKQSVSLVFFAVLSLSVQAHPHSFITLTTDVVVQDGQMSGLKMRWVMDELTSADLLYDAGKAKPGDEVWKKAGGGGDGQRAGAALLHRILAQR